MTMFPQLIAGPIINYKSVDAQLLKRDQGVERFCSGVFIFVVGLCVVFAGQFHRQALDRDFCCQSCPAQRAGAWLGPGRLWPTESTLTFPAIPIWPSDWADCLALSL